MMDYTELLLERIADKRFWQSAIAANYAMAILDMKETATDWPKVNAAIVARWPNGLVRVKEKAWKIVEAKRGR